MNTRLPRALCNPYGLGAVLFMAHFGIWSLALVVQQQNIFELLTHWDAGWYLRLALEGFNQSSRAFLPLFPLMSRLASFWSSNQEFILASGALLSSGLFFLFIWLSESRSPKGPLKPATMWGWALFMLSPASYVFHSFHTESLFLLLSFLAFFSAHKGANRQAAIWAGLSAITRHQGVFVAIACALWAFDQLKGKPLSTRAKAFGLSGAISGAIWLMVPLYHLYQGDSPWAAPAEHAQKWFAIGSMQQYWQTFWFANPIQNMRVGSLIHHGYFFFLLFMVGLSWFRGARPLFWYGLLSLAIMPAQGELVDAFRFGAVLFPFFFIFGD